MELDSHKLILIDNMKSILERCVRACRYCEALSRGGSSNLWSFTQNTYAMAAIIYWCMVFGAKSEQTHFKVLFTGLPESDVSVCNFGYNTVKERFLAAASLDEADYEHVWKRVTLARNKYFGHADIAYEEPPVYPGTKEITDTALELLRIVCELIESAECDGNAGEGERQRLDKLKRLVKCTTVDEYLSSLSRDMEILRGMRRANVES